MCVRSNVIPSAKPTWQWIVEPSKIDNEHLPLPFCWNGVYFAATREEEVWYTPGNLTIRYQKWPYSKAVTFSKSIILGIQLSVFGGVDSSSIPKFEMSPPHRKKGSWLPTKMWRFEPWQAWCRGLHFNESEVGYGRCKEKIPQESPTTFKKKRTSHNHSNILLEYPRNLSPALCLAKLISKFYIHWQSPSKVIQWHNHPTSKSVTLSFLARIHVIFSHLSPSCDITMKFTRCLLQNLQALLPLIPVA